MSRPSRGFFAAGALLTIGAVAVFALSAIYVAFAPRIYSSRAKIIVRSGAASATPIRLQDLPRELFGRDRNVQIQNPKNTSIFEVIAFASEPDTAAMLANRRARELGDGVRARLTADFSLVETAVPNSRAVRPAKKKILISAGVVALNLVLAGLGCLLVDFWKRRRQRAANGALPQPAT